MHMSMPWMHDHHGAWWRRKMFWLSGMSVFWMLLGVFAVLAWSKAGSAAMIRARLKVLKKVPEAFTEEERYELIHKIGTSAMRGI